MQQLANLIVITGGARSGKSALAEKLANESKLAVVYFATMGKVASDTEASDRIDKHVQRRSPNWRTVEEPLMLGKSIRELKNDAGSETLCLVDCLSLYVSNLLLSLPYTIESSSVRRELEENLLLEIDDLLAAMAERPDCQFIVVTNEVGSGIVPDNNLARSYRDLLGLSNQKFAARAASVYLSVSGLSLKLK